MKNNQYSILFITCLQQLRNNLYLIKKHREWILSRKRKKIDDD